MLQESRGRGRCTQALAYEKFAAGGVEAVWPPKNDERNARGTVRLTRFTQLFAAVLLCSGSSYGLRALVGLKESAAHRGEQGRARGQAAQGRGEQDRGQRRHAEESGRGQVARPGAANERAAACTRRGHLGRRHARSRRWTAKPRQSRSTRDRLKAKLSPCPCPCGSSVCSVYARYGLCIGHGAVR